MSKENQIELNLIEQLKGLKYSYRPDIVDRKTLEQNFKAKFEELNRVHLSDNEFLKLREEIINSDVFLASKKLRERQYFQREDGTPLHYTLVNIKDWCKNDFEVISQLRINTENSHQRYDIILLINGLPVVQIELKKLDISPRKAMQQIVDYKNEPGNSYGNSLLCFMQLFIVSNRTNTYYFANNKIQHFQFNADEQFLPIYQLADETNKKITHLDSFTEKFLSKCTLGEMISKYMVLVESEQKLLVMRPYQIYAVKAIEECVKQNRGNGYIWHTTGSGNDEPNNNENIHLKILDSSLREHIAKFQDESPINDKLQPYKPKFDFKLVPVKADNPELGYGSVIFFKSDAPERQIKISRGEERIFVWCFFLALFEIEGWSDIQNKHFFIDDPVSSLDDNNIYITARLILDLFEKHCDSKKIIVTTHHMGLFSVLQDWLNKGENRDKFKSKRNQEVTRGGKIYVKEIIEDKYLVRFLEVENNKYKLVGKKKGVVLYHLLLLQVVNEAVVRKELFTYHFVLLRQILESIASFLGEGRFSYVLDKLNFKDPNIKSDIINSLSHEKIYTQKLAPMNDDNKKLFNEVFEELIKAFPFSI